MIPFGSVSQERRTQVQAYINNIVTEIEAAVAETDKEAMACLFQEDLEKLSNELPKDCISYFLDFSENFTSLSCFESCLILMAANKSGRQFASTTKMVSKALPKEKVKKVCHPCTPQESLRKIPRKRRIRLKLEQIFLNLDESSS